MELLVTVAVETSAGGETEMYVDDVMRFWSMTDQEWLDASQERKTSVLNVTIRKALQIA